MLVLVLVLKDQNVVRVLVLVLDDAVLVLVLAAEVLVLILEEKSLVMSLCSVLFKSQFTDSRTDVVDFESIAFTLKFD